MGTYLDIKIAVEDNLKENGMKHKFSLNLTNIGNGVVENEGWSIYFCSFFMIEPDHLPSADGYILPHYYLKINHIQGCLFSMSPTSGFPRLLANERYFVDFYGQFWAVSRTDLPPNWYVAAPSLKPVNIQSTFTGKRFVSDFTSPRQWKRYRIDQYNPYTAQERYRKYDAGVPTDSLKLVLPTPKHIQVHSNNSLKIRNMTIVCTADLKEEADYLSSKLGLSVLVNNYTQGRTQNNQIFLSVDPTFGNNSEAYNLLVKIKDKTINIFGQTTTAVFYGAQSLISLVDGSFDKISVPEVSIQDEPRYEFRGMHIDIARNFRPKADIIRLMDGMAMYKLNKLHLHLSDDEGWRLEIPDLPELTKVGGKRCHDLTETKCIISQLGSGGDESTSASGFLSVSEYTEIVLEAKKRHIEIIPEIDMPGHARAAIKAMEARFLNYKRTNLTKANQYRLVDPNDTSKYSSVQMYNDNAVNPCVESTYEFLEKVLKEMLKIHPGLKTFHFGGDDVAKGAWVNSTKCQTMAAHDSYYSFAGRLKEYFVHRVSNITNRLGLNIAGWEDGFLGYNGMPYNRSNIPNSKVYANAWQNVWEWGAAKRAYNLANSGYKVIMAQATHLYFDQPNEPDPEEPGLYWATRYTDVAKTFRFLPDRLYRNIDVKRSGERIEYPQVCGKNDANCPPLINTKNIIGLQGNLWSETLLTSEIFDYMVFPRILSLAERAWHKASWEDLDLDYPDGEIGSLSDWQIFANTIGYKEFDRLNTLGIYYRIGPPGAIIKNGTLHVNTEFPGHVVQYSVDNGAIWQDVPSGWRPTYTSIRLRTSSRNGKRFSLAITFYPDEPPAAAEQHLVDYIATKFVVRLDVISNVNNTGKHTISVNLKNSGIISLGPGTWEIGIFTSHLLQPDEYPYPHGYTLRDCHLRLFHVGGSLFKLKPDREFRLSEERDVTCILLAKGYQVAKTDSMPNWYVAAEGMQSKDIMSTKNESLNFVDPFVRPEQYHRFSDDSYSPYSPQERYDINDVMTISGTEAKQVIPTPVHLNMKQNSSVTIDSTWVFYHTTFFEKEAKLIADLFNLSIQHNIPHHKYITLKMAAHLNILHNSHTPDEAYQIDVSTSVIRISAHTSKGAFYAYKTLQSLIQTGNGVNELPEVTIRDQPRFQYRGMHLDVSRNFQPKEEIFKLLEAMATYKLNKFHLHLTDDEGWRLQIPGIPELTEIGSVRCHDSGENVCLLPQLGSGSSKNSYGSGFYTVNDYREILTFANERHIEVIPEISVPIHCRAAKKSMEARFRKFTKYRNMSAAYQFLLTDFDDKTKYLTMQMFSDNAINICMNSTMEFIQYVIKAVKEMHQGAQTLQMIHVGGDGMADVWKDSPECQAFLAKHGLSDDRELRKYFVKQLVQILDKEGLSTGAWEEMFTDNDERMNLTNFPTDRDVTAYNWNNIWEWKQGESAYKLANAGYKVVIGHATHLYFDHTQEPDPEERGTSWASRFIDSRKVFGFVPSNIYYNADKDGNGHLLTRNQICPSNGTCTDLKEPNNIIGMQVQLWTETIRTIEELHEMIFPRLLPAAERAWHQPHWEGIQNEEGRIKKTDQEWSSFAKALVQKELLRLEKMGIKYRIPVPGARIVNDAIIVNTALPEMTVEFSVDNKQTWSLVTSNLIIVGKETIYLRTRSVDGSRYSRVVTMNFQNPMKRYLYKASFDSVHNVLP
ncbi:uncharacterized protein LOC133197995 [Saccostrea echinata]|uniref:uncharacterized protein LOC133197995 n=1 Tax=Saccostrea echinata TaxID=191078 RepID=UPI002A83F9CA|nr:uncharacterized protein LOC133197995 [Saccostrea echinata]